MKLFRGLFLLPLLFSCTEVDDNLGADLVPKNQQMETHVAWFGQDAVGGSRKVVVRSTLFSGDSLPAGRLGLGYLGQVKDGANVFGARRNSMVLQFLPNSMPYEDADKNYGLNPIVDSVYIVMPMTGVRGDTTVLQHFDVYDLKKVEDVPLHRDSLYYANFDVSPIKGEKLFSFTHSGRQGITSRLVPTAEGKAYLNRIVNLDWETYKDNEGFRENFEGLYITPSDAVGTAAAVYQTDLSNSGLQMFVRNHDEVDQSAIYDTLTTRFTFRDSDYYDSYTNYTTVWDNVSINMSEFDYSGSDIGNIVGNTAGFDEDNVARTKTYVQSMGGVGTKLRFTNDLIADLRALKDEGKDIMINQALMYIDLEDKSTASLNSSITRIGSYLKLPHLTPIPDYQYTIEAYKQQGDSKYVLPYNGYLNLSNGRYELDVTTYVQWLLRKEGEQFYVKVSPAFVLGPAAAKPFDFGDSTILNDNSNPIRIRVTYTLVNK